MRDEIAQKRDADRYKTLLSIGKSLIKHDEIEHALHDCYQMINHLPVRNQ